MTANDTVKAISALKMEKKPVKIMKENTNRLAEQLLKLLNDSVKDGVFPTKLKLAKIFPVHKSGRKTNVSNCRPISFLSVFQNFLIPLKNFVMSYFRKQKILNNRQYGFCSGLNTFDAII